MIRLPGIVDAPKEVVTADPANTEEPHSTPDYEFRVAARCLLLFWFLDAGMTNPSTRCGGRRPKSAKARSRGKWGTGGAAGAYGDLAAVR